MPHTPSAAPGPRKAAKSTPPATRKVARTASAAEPEPLAPAQTGDYLTTAGGVHLPDADHSLKAGERGPTLLEDFHFREKMTHFDHERIPERVVHARGAAAHGTFNVVRDSGQPVVRSLSRQGRRDAGVHPVLDGGGFTRLG